MRLNTRGQSVLPEYVLSFFLVIAVVVAMTVYIQRALQARVNDARDYMIKTASSECDQNCLKAAGTEGLGRLSYIYEPYYAQVDSTTSRTGNSDSALIADLGHAGIYRKYINEQSVSDTFSGQRPPMEAQ